MKLRTEVHPPETQNDLRRNCSVAGSGLGTRRARMLPLNSITKEPETEMEDRLQIPLDLTEWISKELLCKWITENIESLNWGNPALQDYLNRHPQYRPKELLAILILAYATGVYASEDIEAQCWKEEMFRSIVGKDVPTTPQLRRFRRENRGLLKWILAEIIRQALREKYALGDALLPPGLRRYLQELAVERLNLARHLDHSSSDM